MRLATTAAALIASLPRINACHPTPPLHPKATRRQSQPKHRAGATRSGSLVRGDLLLQTRTALRCEATASELEPSRRRPGALALLAASVVAGLVIASPAGSQTLPGTLGPLAGLSDHGPSRQALIPHIGTRSHFLNV